MTDTVEIDRLHKRYGSRIALHELDLDKLAYTRPLLLPATMNLLDGSVSLPHHDGVLGLVLPPELLKAPQAGEHMRKLRDKGVEIGKREVDEVPLVESAPRYTAADVPIPMEPEPARLVDPA